MLISSVFSALLIESQDNRISAFTPVDDPDPPEVDDLGFRVEKVITGLAMPTSMAFLGDDDILILEKNSGKVRLVSDGILLEESLLEVVVSTNSEQGLLGTAVSDTTVFIYYTEEDAGDVRNRVYRYTLAGNSLTDETLILDLPATPGPNHDGGKLAIGPDETLYAIIGDVSRNGKLQNYPAGPDPDDTSVILKVDFDGAPAANILSGASGLDSYYAYGVRNSFGMDFDPVTGTLWDTENGPDKYDEINAVEPGFNSGWVQVMGPIGRTSVLESELVAFTGSQYADPAFSWFQPIGVTDIEFLSSTSLGAEYANNMFVGDFNNGNLYYFEINEDRDGIDFGNIPEPIQTELADLVADDIDERDAVTFGTGFGGITDIETGPDGYLYILTFDGDIYRIVPETLDDIMTVAESVMIGANLARSITDELTISTSIERQKMTSSGGGGSGGGGSSGGGNRVVVTNQQDEVKTTETFPESHFEENPLDRIEINDAGFVDANGNDISKTRVGQQISIASTFTNRQQEPQDYSFIVMIIDKEDFAIDIAWQEGTVESGQTVDLSTSWMPQDDGTYTVKIFIWDGMDNPSPLTNAVTNNIVVD